VSAEPSGNETVVVPAAVPPRCWKLDPDLIADAEQFGHGAHSREDSSYPRDA
jgi:hypothetical protein